MKKSRKTVLAIPIIVIVLILGYASIMGIQIGINSPSLEFPIREEDRVTRLSAYYTPDWGEVGVYHNGIDLVISNNVTIISPVRGTIISYSEKINPYAGNVLFKIAIAINLVWEVHLVLEPGFKDGTNNSIQSSLIDAPIGKQLSVGDELGTLLVSDSYPHLHYMLLYLGSDVCAYNHSSVTAKSVFEDIALSSNSSIFFSHPELNPLLAPIGLMLISGIVTYIVIAIIIFKKN
ncbi:hypothetical protein EU527_19490 [Candidatus Thorarchaeota archaeon]|nr:MAG: hypothetical protein EU527_19490 [Candidatus Thorarchaeota archaeon]